jgi:hypothetical protein
MKNLSLGKLKRMAIAVFAICLFSSSCKKDGTTTVDETTTTPTTAVTTQQVADVTSNAVASASYGLQSSVAKALQTAVDNKIYSTTTQATTCGITISNNYSVAQAANGYSYKYSVAGTYKLTCGNAGAPSTYNYTSSMEGSYETPKLSSTDKAQAELSFESIASSSTDVSGSGTYTRNGSQTPKEQGKAAFTSTILIKLNTLVMNKNTAVILSGTGTATITTTTAGVTKNYTGEITFKGNGLAVLVIDGVSYNITL